LFDDPLGTVWEGVSGGTGAPVAVRVFDGPVVEGPDACGRLRRRLAETPQIQHPNVALVLSYEVVDHGTSFMTMEPLRGETLAQRLERDGTIPLQEAAEIGAALARGLAAGHALGVTHGGIEPELVFLTPRGPKLLGFGIGDLARGQMSDGEATAANDVLEVRQLVRMMAADFFGEGNGERSLRSRAMSGETVVNTALSLDPAFRPSAVELAAALGGAPIDARSPAIPNRVPEAAPKKREQPETDELERERIEKEQAEREGARREEAERERAARERREERKRLAAQPRSAGEVRRTTRRAVAAAVVITLLLSAGVRALVISRNEASPTPSDAQSASPSTSPPSSPTPAIVPATVPDITGMTLQNAVARIHEAKLEVGDVVPVGGLPGRVVRTDPTPGEAVTAGTRVTIFMGS
jgi:hypothetical protein